MASLGRPVIIIAGIAGLCVSAVAGVGLGSYTASGMNPFYGKSSIAVADPDAPRVIDGRANDTTANDKFSETVARSLTGRGFGDRANDAS
ncbi:MAG: hypothetical protein WC804_04135 [Sphingomonas sp.]|jgi:hypothetical protein|uniref:hypothetical protein n=1 Tax=Sphingomonas sp. TaxID=28214 RepID=UPI003565CAF6